MIVFHASTVKIEEFYVPFGGLHLGGMMSAVDCALLKLKQDRRHLRDLTLDSIYIHRCLIELGEEYEAKDQGSDSGWKKLYYQLLNDEVDYDYIRYINEYEPDVVPSYCFFETSKIKILDCTKMHMDVAEDYLRGIHADQYRYDLEILE
jgi:hypothetical protein